MSYGYTLRLVERNLEADPEQNLGVRLGRACIEMRIPVTEVAQRFDVSRQTVYNWFSGDSAPADSLTDKIEAFLSTLT